MRERGREREGGREGGGGREREGEGERGGREEVREMVYILSVGFILGGALDRGNLVTPILWVGEENAMVTARGWSYGRGPSDSARV